MTSWENTWTRSSRRPPNPLPRKRSSLLAQGTGRSGHSGGRPALPMNRKALHSTSTRFRDVEIADDSIRGTDPVGSPTPSSGSPQTAPSVGPAAPDEGEIQYRELLERIPAVTYIAGFGE